ncbi:DUF2069 domain-containing protein [Lysobacter xanthus]
MNARAVLVSSLVALAAVYAAWFGGRAEWVALVVFAAPVFACLVAVLRRTRTGGFWSSVLALAWFSHGVMVAWTRPAELGYALAEVALSVAIVLAASLPGLRARFARRG